MHCIFAFMIITRENFKYEREKLGMSRKEFAELLGYDYQTIRLKEMGERGITVRDRLLLQNIDRLLQEYNKNKNQ